MTSRRNRYVWWHKEIRKRRGRPGSCVLCESSNTVWALREEFHVPGEMVWVEDEMAYEPLCYSCHNDRDHRGYQHSEKARENMCAAQKTAHSARVASGAFDRFITAATSPESSAKKSASLKQHFALNPERKNPSVNKIRVTCETCGRKSTPAGMARHRRVHPRGADHD